MMLYELAAMFPRYYRWLLPMLLLGIFSCDSEQKKTIPAKKEPKQKKAFVKMASPRHQQKLKLGDSILFKLTLTNEAAGIERLSVFLDGEELKSNEGKAMEFKWPSTNLGLGEHRAEYEVKYEDGKKDRRFSSFTVLAAKAPARQTFSIIDQYPHDDEAYTQGLLWHEGKLYESTGQYNESNLRRVDLLSGKVEKQVDLAGTFFGEGLTLFGNDLIQLTWTSRQGFVYDVNSFEKKRVFDYPTEGWGITHNGKHLIMSDGTEKLYFMDPATFTIEHEISVYNHLGPIRNLNELEFINGEIWANIYTTTTIARIDPSNGVVNALIDLKGIVEAKDAHANMDHLNGIAYDEKGERLFVTGKNWKRLYEIEVKD